MANTIRVEITKDSELMVHPSFRGEIVINMNDGQPGWWYTEYYNTPAEARVAVSLMVCEITAGLAKGLEDLNGC